MLLEEARKIAVAICYKLQPFCEKINIAGSVRRQKAEVNDIEICCVPKVEVLKDGFGWDEGIIRNIQFANTVDTLGKVIKGNTDGKYMQIELPEGVNLDLFICCRMGFLMILKERMEKAVENDKKLEQMGL